ncbi:hypothetical protein JAAARDRAFT_374323 [Jaapia argillacea MUCL 33604]|uniref:RRM domain-containing protein n=1 Tax=Jaapia argillacea MUCL 33604 TaxID=933084 RepID=A0A067QIG7_9AGAM|nr:hypothetical protein JAAARDRAFT_374323 [Jaapia argillacea MUCL 33604]
MKQRDSNSEDAPESPSSSNSIPTVTNAPLPSLFYSPPSEERDLGSVMQQRQRLHRRSSRKVRRWLAEQHRASTGSELEDTSDLSDAPVVGTACNPYLAYPQLKSRSPGATAEQDERGTLESFIVVEDDDIRQADEELQRAVHEEQAGPSTPTRSTPIDSPTPSKTRRYSSLLHAHSPLRNLHLSFPSSRRQSSTSTSAPQTSPASKSLFQKSSSSTFTPQHTRATSWSSICLPGHKQTTVEDPPESPRSSSTWRFKRPSVLGHFSSSTQTSLMSHPRDEEELAPPRPSFSSSAGSYSSASTSRTPITEPPKTPRSPRTFSFGSTRTVPAGLGNPFYPASTLSLSPSNYSEFGQPKSLSQQVSTLRVPFASKPPINNTLPPVPPTPTTVHYGSKVHVPSVLTTPGERKKKKLVISGIGIGEVTRFEAVKRWCEGFGELSQITRMPSGDIYVHFRKAEVADRVCRLNARVYIDGVGSVSLSWFTGKKPT